jgi:hypothetical protein
VHEDPEFAGLLGHLMHRGDDPRGRKPHRGDDRHQRLVAVEVADLVPPDAATERFSLPATERSALLHAVEKLEAFGTEGSGRPSTFHEGRSAGIARGLPSGRRRWMLATGSDMRFPP